MGKKGTEQTTVMWVLQMLIFSSSLPSRTCFLRQGERVLCAAEAGGWEHVGHHRRRGAGGAGCPAGILHLAAEEQEGICPPGHPARVMQGMGSSGSRGGMLWSVVG